MTYRRPVRRTASGQRPMLIAVGLVAIAAALVFAGPLGSFLPGTSPGATSPSSSGLGGSPIEVPPTAEATQAAVRLPIVPVTSFRAPWPGTNAAEVRAVFAGSSRRYRTIEIVGAEVDPLLSAIGAARPTNAAHLVAARNAATLRRDMAAHSDRLGFLPLADVDPSVRAIEWDSVSLFGVHRLATLDGWPLSIPAPAGSASAAPTATYDPASAWTLVAGGDINLDGAVAYHVKTLRLGVDFPFAGGTAKITSHYCCSFHGELLPRASRTGNGGAVRDLLSSADLTIANFENPAPDDFVYHPGGYVFSADPALIQGLSDAGIDWVSMANNHVGDSGASGIADTIKNLDRWGIAHGGAGADLAAARAPSILTAGGQKVAILGYDTIRPAYGAGPSTPGSNEMSPARVRADIKAARALGATFVIVFPHWGTEYTATPTALQRSLAHAAIDAGADLVIGNHPHWAGAVEVYRGVPTFYALGDFVFNIDRSEQTEEGITLEYTFAGTRLVQVQMHPYLILDGSQPNFLDPAGSGKVVMNQVFGASRGLLPW